MRGGWRGLVGMALVACGSSSVRQQYGDDAAPPLDGAPTPSADAGPLDFGEGGSGSSGATGDPSQLTSADLEPCDQGLAIDGDAEQMVRALGLCKRASENDAAWGVIEASYRKNVGGDPAPAKDPQHGILPRFGSIILPREGALLGALSTGWAREFDDETGSSKPFVDGVSFGAGNGRIPQEFGSPFEDVFAQDLINLRLRIRVPSNARGFSFDFNFHSSEWPNYVPSEFNDHFVAYLTDSANPQGRNISFDAQNRPVSVNLGFFDRCTPGANTGCAGEGAIRQASCPGGEAELAGTGFGTRGIGCGPGNANTQGGSTGWLTTRSPAQPGEIITLELAIWDTNDTARDSLVLLDNFRWEAEPVEVGTSRPPN